MAAMVEVGLCGVGPAGKSPRMAVPDEFSADEIRAALMLTRRAADTQFWLAYDLVSRLPAVHAAVADGVGRAPLACSRVAAACGHIDALAKAAKRAGDGRPIDHIRAELLLGMTDGSYAGLDDVAILKVFDHRRTSPPQPLRDHRRTVHRRTRPHGGLPRDRGTSSLSVLVGRC